jgi:excisionase family DNA binding protein
MRRLPPDPSPEPDADAFLTVKEIAALDRCSEKTVRRAIAAGLLAAVRIGPGGRAVRVTRAAHARYRAGEWR